MIVLLTAGAKIDLVSIEQLAQRDAEVKISKDDIPTTHVP